MYFTERKVRTFPPHFARDEVGAG